MSSERMQNTRNMTPDNSLKAKAIGIGSASARIATAALITGVLLYAPDKLTQPSSGKTDVSQNSR